MIVYLSLKQILLNQIAVLIRKQSDKSNDDPERLLRRLNYLQDALEQIKSYQHNKNFQNVIKYFNIELTESEQQEIGRLSQKFDDGTSASFSSKSKRNEKSGFTTQRSETLFTGASEERYDGFMGGGSDNELDDEKIPTQNTSSTPPHWIHYRGFAHWLKKQSFIKFKKRNDTDKYKKIWNTVIGLNLFNLWDKGKIKPMNIIGRYGTSQPYIAIHKCGTKEIVKASLLRLSVTQNRIFRFNIEANEDETIDKNSSKSRARRSIDMDNEQEYNNGYKLSANELTQGRNLFDQVGNKDVLRIVATMLWDTNLANNVLEELLHNPRFSMYGIHAKNIADTIAKEMNLNTMSQSSYTPDQSPNPYQQQPEPEPEPQPQPPSSKPQSQVAGTGAGGTEQVAQFTLPPSPQKTSLQKQKEINQNVGYSKNGGAGGSGGGGSFYNPNFNTNTNNNNNNSYANNNNASTADTFSFTKSNTNNNNNNNLNNNKIVSDKSVSSSPQPMAEENKENKPGHKPHSASVVFHENIRESEINDGIVYHDGDDGDDEDYHDGDDEDYTEIPQNR